jgi:hypothetical protein
MLAVVDRDLRDAAVPGLSSDRLFLVAYEAVLTLASVPLRCAGYETHGQGHHRTTFQALPLSMGDALLDLSIYFESCRSKRNVGSYDRSGAISRSEASELLKEARLFREAVMKWLWEVHPELQD